MPYVIGTAGHIDHGKTSLVKALTGQDTDRLKEEKERGISIELGFAHLDLPDLSQAGVVDVPGHERFIRQMLAGAHGIDLVLFTVAADDGVMPQTEEHLDIVHLLGVRRGIFVITKADLATARRLAEVEDEVRALAAGTTLADAPVVAFSSVTGQGLDTLRTRIEEILAGAGRPRPSGYFRLPVDRVFVLQGHGQIVTGTALAGDIHVGDRVRCLPGDQLFRVRSLQVHGRPVETATWGQRVAVNLAGQDKAPVERGQVICHEKITRTTDRFDATLEIRHKAGVKNHQRVRVHLGTAERLATLVLLEGGFCQVALKEPMLVLRGDRFIIRDETAQRTLGGGVVLQPWAVGHRRKDPTLRESLSRLAGSNRGDLARVFLAGRTAFAEPIGPIAQFLNIEDEDAARLMERQDGLRTLSIDGETLYTTDEKWHQLRKDALATLRDFHAAHPLSPGMEMEAARERFAAAMPPRIFRAVVEQFETEGAVARAGSLLRLADHVVRLRDDEQQLADRITSLLEQAPFAPPDIKQIERDLGVPRARLAELLRVLERQHTVVRVTPDLYFPADSLAKVKAELERHLSERSDITPATFRDLFGTTRKYAIPLLEYLDREGVTVRVGDARRLKRSAVAHTTPRSGP